MLLTRFWYIILAVIASAGVSAALLSLGVINRQAEEHVTDELHRDRTDLDAILRLEARARLDRIAFISVDNKLGSLLKQASSIGDRGQLSKVSSDTKAAMNAHVASLLEAQGDSKSTELKPDIAFAVDMHGRIVAQLGPLESNPPGTSLATYPFIARALQGYVRDDVVVYDRRVYRMASRPVLYGGDYVGAIAHGYRFDDQFAQRVAKGLGGASVAFFYGTSTLASSMTEGAEGAPPLAEVAAALPEALKDKHLQEGERTEPMRLQTGARAVFSLMVGSAAQSDVGYAIARPLHVIASPLAFFQDASKQDIQALPLVWIGAACLLLALVGLVFVHVERDRPQRALRLKLADIAAGERDRLLVTEWRGAYRTLADAINHALEKAAERAAEIAPASKKKANLDEILGPTPDSHVEPYFGFAETSPGAKPAGMTGKSTNGVTHATAQTAQSAAQAVANTGSLNDLSATQTLPPEAAMPAPKPREAPAAPPISAPKPAAKQAPAAAKQPAPAALPLQGSNDNADTADTALHFREVYAQYLSVRKDCGESTDGLSYEKFELTLTKTRDQVLQKHPAKDVRFTVYVKEGKAALKAAPVRR